MDIDAQAVINDLLDQNKQLTLQLAIARSMIARLEQQNHVHGHHHHDHSSQESAE